MSMAMMGNELLICFPLPIRHKMAEKGHRFVSVYRERAKWLWGDIHSLFSSHVETVALLSKLDVNKHIYVDITTDELDLTTSEQNPTYAEIIKYILDTTGTKVSNLNIAQVKRKCGIETKDAFCKPKSSDSRQPSCTKEKEELIMEAFRHFKMIN